MKCWLRSRCVLVVGLAMTLGMALATNEAARSQSTSPRLFLPTVFNQFDSGVPPPTSIDLIVQAESAGRITAEQAALYKLQALVVDPTLPREFVGPGGMRGVHASPIVSEVAAKWNAFSPQARSALLPYVVRPNDSLSYFNGARAVRASARLTTAVEVGPAANNRILVWGTAVTSPAALAVQAQLGIGPTDNVLGPIEALMGRKWAGDSGLNTLWFDKVDPNSAANKDDRLDVYVVPYGDSGATVAADIFPSASYVIINEGGSAEEIEASVWHELFHVIQNRFEVKDDKESVKWWLEESANWAIARFAPNNHVPYDYHADDYLARPYERLDLWGSSIRDQNHAYGGFLWPVVFEGGAGTGGASVAAIWGKLASMSPLAAMQSVLGAKLEEQWRDFTLANYNRDEVRRTSGGGKALYASWAPNLQTTDPYRIPAQLLKPRSLDAAGTPYQASQDIRADVTRMAAQYFQVQVTADTRQILFRLDDWTKQTGAGLVVLKRKEGESWSSLNLTDIKDDWTKPTGGAAENWRYFCRDKKDENIEEFILIFSNANISTDLSATVKVEMSNVACRWRGTVQLTHNEYAQDQEGNQAGYTLSQNVTITGLWANQVSPLDVFRLSADAVFTHVMPVRTAEWTLTASIDSEGREDGKCTGGTKSDATYTYSLQNPKLLPTLIIWSQNYNAFTFWTPEIDLTTFTWAVTCGTSDRPTFFTVRPFWIGKSVSTYGMPEPGPCTTDETRRVSANGRQISATWDVSKQGPGANPCGLEYESWTYLHRVTINLTAEKEP